jgi:hypothetical protein
VYAGATALPLNGKTITRSKFVLPRNCSSSGSRTSSTIRKRSCAWFAIQAMSSGARRRLSVCITPPAAGMPK